MKKKNIFIAIIVILLFVAGIILMFSKKRGVSIEPEESSIPDISQEENQEQKEEKVVDSLVVLRKQLENRARFFIERYNTYSSDNNQENLRSLLPQVSNKLAKEMEYRLTKEIGQNDIFFGIQTKVLFLNLSDFIDNEKVTFNGQIQEQETNQDEIEIHYKTVILEFIYKNAEWKVDDIEIK